MVALEGGDASHERGTPEGLTNLEAEEGGVRNHGREHLPHGCNINLS